MKRLICLLAFTLAWAVQAAVTVTPGTWDLYRGTSIVSSGHASQSACAAAADALGVARTYTCRTRSTVVVTTAPPAAVNCVVSVWSAWTAGPAGFETRTRTVVTPAANGGTACPALSEQRTVTPPPPPAGGENVGSWSQATFGQPFRISMEPGSYPVWVAGGARHENLTGSWDGGRVARIYPPTAGQTYGGIGAFTLPSGVSTLSLRWEMRTGPTYASGGQGFDDNKHVIIHTQNGNRAMMNIQSAGNGCLQMAIAQGTVKQFNQSAVGGNPPGWFRGDGNYRFRWCDTGSSANTVAALEWLSIELQISCGASLHASGHIRAVVTRRNSSTPVADWWIPWNYDPSARCTNFTGVESIGDYYNGNGNGASGTWFDIAGVTIATNKGLLGPRAGFVQ